MPTVWISKGTHWDDAEYKKRFNEFDKDNDGKLTGTERHFDWGADDPSAVDMTNQEKRDGLALENKLAADGTMSYDDWGKFLRYYIKNYYDQDGGGGDGGNNNRKGGAPSRLRGSFAEYWDKADKDNNDTGNGDHLEGSEARTFASSIKGDSRYKKLSNRDKDKVNGLLDNRISVNDALKIRSIFD